MSKRIFIALNLSKSLKQVLTLWQSRHFDLPVRWIAEKNFHITIIPPWEETDVPSIIECLKQAPIGVKPFSIHLNQIKLGPKPQEPRLIWAAGPTPPEILQLKSNLEQALGQTPVDRPFHLHITLARFQTRDYHQFAQQDLTEPIDWQDQIASLSLLESHRTPAGSNYQPLAEFLL